MVNVLPLQKHNNDIFLQFVTRYNKYPINIFLFSFNAKSHHGSTREECIETFFCYQRYTWKTSEAMQKVVIQMEIYCHCLMIWSPCDKQIYWKQEQEYSNLS